MPIETLKVGSPGTRNMLELARSQGARFLLASTSEMLRRPAGAPPAETYWGNVNPVGPRACYDESKRFAEALTMAYHRAHGAATRTSCASSTPTARACSWTTAAWCPASSTRRLRGEPLTVFGDGSQTRSFCYVSDLVEGLYRLMLSDERYPVNLGNRAR